MIYGNNNTVHKTQDLDVEIDEKTGEVVAVWFRCTMLPFNISKANEQRVNQMVQAYKNGNSLPKLNAVDIEYEHKL